MWGQEVTHDSDKMYWKLLFQLSSENNLNQTSTTYLFKFVTNNKSHIALKKTEYGRIYHFNIAIGKVLNHSEDLSARYVR